MHFHRLSRALLECGAAADVEHPVVGLAIDIHRGGIDSAAWQQLLARQVYVGGGEAELSAYVETSDDRACNRIVPPECHGSTPDIALGKRRADVGRTDLVPATCHAFGADDFYAKLVTVAAVVFE